MNSIILIVTLAALPFVLVILSYAGRGRKTRA